MYKHVSFMVMPTMRSYHVLASSKPLRNHVIWSAKREWP